MLHVIQIFLCYIACIYEIANLSDTFQCYMSLVGLIGNRTLCDNDLEATSPLNGEVAYISPSNLRDSLTGQTDWSVQREASTILRIQFSK